PPLIWNGFKGIGTETSIVANCATIAHDSNEIERKSPFDTTIPYSWEIKHG
ncbi:MAG: DTDP-4-dehydrorhamnose epimerase, partial [uncultured bacterium]